jgi:hypothetical protein
MNLYTHILLLALAWVPYIDPSWIRQVLLEIEETKACSSAAAREFDFWLGDWEVTASGKLAGNNKISRAAGDCALLEEYQGQSGYSGKSLNFFNPELDKWQQIWVGSAGDILVLTGEYGGGKMILAGESTQSGKKVQNRITWFNNVAEGTVRQLWESSEDAGKSWKVVFDGLYTKKKP